MVYVIFKAHLYPLVCLYLQMPILESKLNEFYAILESHAQSGAPIDIDDLLVCLTVDFV